MTDNKWEPEPIKWKDKRTEELMCEPVELWFHKSSKTKPIHFVTKTNRRRPNENVGWYYFGTYPLHIAIDISNIYAEIPESVCRSFKGKKLLSVQLERRVDRSEYLW